MIACAPTIAYTSRIAYAPMIACAHAPMIAHAPTSAGDAAGAAHYTRKRGIFKRAEEPK